MKGITRKNPSQEVGFLSFLRTLMSASLPLIKNVLTPLAKSVLVLLGLTKAASTTNAAIQKKIFGSGKTASIISNEEMEDIMNIAKSFEESGLLIKRVSETIKNEAKEQKVGFLEKLLGTLAESILGNTIAGKPKISGQLVIRTGKGVIQAGEGTTRADQNF